MIWKSEPNSDVWDLSTEKHSIFIQHRGQLFDTVNVLGDEWFQGALGVSDTLDEETFNTFCGIERQDDINEKASAKHLFRDPQWSIHWILARILTVGTFSVREWPAYRLGRFLSDSTLGHWQVTLDKAKQ